MYASQLVLGATVRLTAEESSGKTLVKLSYDASRLEEDPPENRMPDWTEFSIDTTLRLDLGKTVLVGGSSEASSTYLAISVK